MRKSRVAAAALMLCILLAAFTGCNAAGLVRSVLSQNKEETEYSNPIDKWRNEFVTEYTARIDAIDGLLGAADLGDRSAFADMFAAVVKNNEKFSAQLNSFFESYPVGLSECELNRTGGGAGGSYKYGDAVKTVSDVYNCRLGDEWYRIVVHYCIENTTDPDEIGIIHFHIENFEADALDREYSEDDFIVCSIVDESMVTARMIGGRPFVFEPTPERSITLEQMKEYLKEYDDFRHLSQAIGEPNVEKTDNGIDCDYYYELTSSDGSLLYVLIETIGQRILRSYACNEEKIFFEEDLSEES